MTIDTYTRYRAYADFQAANPDTEFNGTDFDTDFQRLKVFADAVVAGLAQVRRDDGGVKNNSIGADQLKAEIIALLNGVNPRGDWTTTTSYALKDMVRNANIMYFCLVAHTSGTFATDLAAHKWMAISALTGASTISNTPAGTIAATDVQAALNELDTEKQATSVTLAAIAGLVGAANKLAYFTGASTAALTDITALGRTILAGVVGSDVTTAIGALNKSGGTMTGSLTLAANPVTSLEAATKAYADGLALRGQNRLINGAFSVDQRNQGFSQTVTTTTPMALCDRWQASRTGATITGQQVAGTGGNQYAYLFTGAASNTGIKFSQKIAAEDCYDLVSSNVAVSLQCKSSAIATLTWTVYTPNVGDNYVAKTVVATGTLSINSVLAAYSFTFNAGANAGNGLMIEFSCGALLGAQTLQFENVQVESGLTASTFERRSYAHELMLCKRFLHIKRSGAAGDLAIVGYGYTNNLLQHWPDHFPTMRRAPGFSFSAVGDFQIAANNTTLAATALTSITTSADGALLSTANVGYAVNIPGSLAALNSAAYLCYDAEIP